MPTFCRHNHLVQNCPICSKEQHLEMRPVVSPGGHTVRPSRPAGEPGTRSPARSGAGRSGTSRSGGRGSGGLTVRRLSRAAEDGYHSGLVPGLRSSTDAQRLAEEMAFAATRLERLQSEPPGLYAEVADASLPLEERTWLAFLIAYLGPLDDDAPFAGIERARTAWSAGEAPRLDDVPLGPRTAHEAGRGRRTIDAYRQWAERAGWLIVLFLGEMLTATAMGYFEKEIERAVVLALFVPLIISSGGNSGSQASTLVIRAIALGELRLRDWWRVVRREVAAGVALGSLLGTIGLARILSWVVLFHAYGAHYLLVGFTVAGSLVGVVTFGTMAGSLLPFVLRRLGFDPASACAPLVATLVDVSGLVIYFSVASFILRGTLL